MSAALLLSVTRFLLEAGPPADLRPAKEVRVPGTIRYDTGMMTAAFKADLDGNGRDDIILLEMSTLGVADRTTFLSVHMDEKGITYRREKVSPRSVPGEVTKAPVWSPTLVRGRGTFCVEGRCFGWNGRSWTKKSFKAGR